MRKRLGIVWLPWATLLLFMGAWLYTAWAPLGGFLARWPLAARWPFLIVAGMLPLFRTKDFQEGMASFLEKRPPKFEGR